MAQSVMGELLDELLGKGNYSIGIDEAAFYGPKLDIQMRNVHGKEDTLVTIQIDMLLAKKFGMSYVDSDNTMKTPYIIHRTSLGCYERTLALLIEKYAGALPTWMAPVQVRFLPMGDEQVPYCEKIVEDLTNMGVRAEIDKRNETIGYKIREAQLQKLPYMAIVGDKELQSNTIAVRSRKNGDLGAVDVDKFTADLLMEIAKKTR
jgi:threonyl-tRNA synthetase